MASSMKKSVLSLDDDKRQARSNSNTSCKTDALLASVTSNTIDFWNRLSQQMSFIDGSTQSSSLGDQHRALQEGNHHNSFCMADIQQCSSKTEVFETTATKTQQTEIFPEEKLSKFQQKLEESNASASWSYCACSYSSAVTHSIDQTPPDSPLVIRGRSVSCNQNESKDLISFNDVSRASLQEEVSHQCAKVLYTRFLPSWQTPKKISQDCYRNSDNDSQKQGSIYSNFLNDDCDEYDDEDGEGENEDLEMELLQTLPGRGGQIVTLGSTSTDGGLDTASMGGGRGRGYNHKKVHYRKRNMGDGQEDRFLTNNPSTFAQYGSRGLSRKKASSSWEESETVQRRRSLMLAANLEQCPTGGSSMHPGRIIMPTASQLDLLDKRDLRYYFQHPYPRLFVTYFVIFCNFLLFAEDPISHSHTESDIPMVGNVFSFVVTKYPPEWRWTVIKVLMWILAMLCGMIAGKLLIHGYLCGRLLRLKMFRDDQGSWMTMFMTVIVSLYMFSHAYNLMLLLWYHDPLYQITSHMGVTNASVMKAAACGTWLGDLITALMVTDMMLQDNLYPTWATWFRRIWRKSNIPRILIFWVGSVLATSVVVTLIVSDWISWDKLNKDFISTNEISRAFLASFILVMDLLIVMQDWDFPNFTTTLHINLPGMNVATLQWKYAEVDITGKWFNYGIIFLVMMLDLNMWKNQIFYNPKDYGQYTDIDDKVRTVNEDEVRTNTNVTYWTWEMRSSLFNSTTGRFAYEDDMLMNSRYMGYPLSAKWTAFIPSVIGLVMLVTLVTLYGRFPSNQSHPRDRPADQFRDIGGKQQDLTYCERPEQVA